MRDPHPAFLPAGPPAGTAGFIIVGIGLTPDQDHRACTQISTTNAALPVQLALSPG